MNKDKITFSVSKKFLLVALILLLIFFLPIPSYQTLPIPCSLIYPNPKCQTKKQGWVFTKPFFFRIVDFLKYNLLPQPPGGLEESGERTTEGGTINSGEPQLGDAADKDECLEMGGVWRQWGMLQKEYCQIPAPDAGQECNDGSQCQYGKCISENGEIPGKCAEFKNMFGCMSLIENGQLGSTLCID